MRRGARTFAIIFLFFAPTIFRAQSKPPQLIEEFGKLNSEEIQNRLWGAMIQLGNRVETNPDSMLEFVFHRGENQPVGEPFRNFATLKAFYAAENYDTRRIVS